LNTDYQSDSYKKREKKGASDDVPLDMDPIEKLSATNDSPFDRKNPNEI
jgi:hypothetical protein